MDRVADYVRHVNGVRPGSCRAPSRPIAQGNLDVQPPRGRLISLVWVRLAAVWSCVGSTVCGFLSLSHLDDEQIKGTGDGGGAGCGV
jgi:hypothetical protein